MDLENSQPPIGDLYSGPLLDNLLKPYGLTRFEHESDESLRGRAFEELVLTTREDDISRRTVALELLFGHRGDDWDPNMKDLALEFIDRTKEQFIKPFILDQPEDRRGDYMRNDRVYSPLDNAMRYLKERWEVSSSHP